MGDRTICSKCVNFPASTCGDMEFDEILAVFLGSATCPCFKKKTWWRRYKKGKT